MGHTNAILFTGVIFIVAVACQTNEGSLSDMLHRLSQNRELNDQQKLFQLQQLRMKQNQQTFAAPIDGIPDQRFDREISVEVANSVMNLAQKILQYTINSGNPKADVISPLSIAAALSMVELGAKGQTFSELSELLYSKGNLRNIEPWRIHEQLGILLEDVVNEIPSPNRPRTTDHWKKQKYEYGGGIVNRFNFPTDNSDHVAPTIPYRMNTTPIPPSVQPLAPEYNQDFLPTPQQPQPPSELNIEPVTADPPPTYPQRRPRPAASIGNNQISIANALFVQSGYSLRRDYRSAVERVYNSEVTPLNFLTNIQGAVQYVNNWVSDKTHGKIKKIVSENLSPVSKILIVSALYFKAEWDEMFLEGATQKKPFYPDGKDGRQVMTELMAHGGKFPFYESPQYDCRIIGFPYKRGQTTMYVILPNNSSRNKLRDMQSQLSAEAINDMIARMEMKTAIVLFPKLQLTADYNLKPILRDLGISSLLSPTSSDLSLISNGYEKDFYAGRPSDAQFSGSRNDEFTQQDQPQGLAEQSSIQFPSPRAKRDVSYKVESSIRRESEPLKLKDLVLNKRITKPNPSKKPNRSRRQADQIDPSQFLRNLDQARASDLQNPRLFANEIVHKVDLTVNERGTEGGAATSISLNRSGTDVVFRTDTPFMIVIRHDTTKLVLFYGTIYDPSA